jgi:hypothetical protein
MKLASTTILDLAARELAWLLDRKHGLTTQEIATRENLTTRRVRLGIARARATQPSDPGDTVDPYIRPPRLVPLFPIEAFVPSSVCRHGRSLRRGSPFCCMVCNKSGQDGHPGLRRNRRNDPKREPPPSTPPPLKAKVETRRQRRARLFGIPTSVTSTADVTLTTSTEPPPATT